MAEHVLNVMHRPAALEEARPAFMTQIVEVEIDRTIRGF
jgi:hypothetical protein